MSLKISWVTWNFFIYTPLSKNVSACELFKIKNCGHFRYLKVKKKEAHALTPVAFHPSTSSFPN